MHRLTLRFLLAALSVIALAVTPAEARKPQSHFEQHIVHLRQKVDKKFGPNAAGRRIIEQGPRGGGRPPMKLKIRYRDALVRMLHPPVVKPAPVLVAPQPVDSSASSYGAAPQSSGGSGGGCSGMSAESGSLGYNNNTHAGYVGCYQISQDHFNGGSCSGLGTDPAGQDQCAAIICQTEGAGAWTNPQGQNPCGRLGR